MVHQVLYLFVVVSPESAAYCVYSVFTNGILRPVIIPLTKYISSSIGIKWPITISV